MCVCDKNVYEHRLLNILCIKNINKKMFLLLGTYS